MRVIAIFNAVSDGEVILTKPPLRYRIHPRALRVIVPAAIAEQECRRVGRTDE